MSWFAFHFIPFYVPRPFSSSPVFHLFISSVYLSRCFSVTLCQFICSCFVSLCQSCSSCCQCFFDFYPLSFCIFLPLYSWIFLLPVFLFQPACLFCLAFVSLLVKLQHSSRFQESANGLSYCVKMNGNQISSIKFVKLRNMVCTTLSA